MKYHSFSVTALIKTVLAKLATEPAAVIGLLASVGDLFAKGWTPEAAIPAAAGLIIRFFVTPTSKVTPTPVVVNPANAPTAGLTVTPTAPTDQAGAVSAVELCVIVLTGLVILLLLGVIR